LSKAFSSGKESSEEVELAETEADKELKTEETEAELELELAEYRREISEVGREDESQVARSFITNLSNKELCTVQKWRNEDVTR
jgi:hypothetical protein